MKTLKETLNESVNFSKMIADAIFDWFSNANTTEDIKKLLNTFEEELGDIAMHLEMNGKSDELKELETWAKKHKFNL